MSTRRYLLFAPLLFLLVGPWVFEQTVYGDGFFGGGGAGSTGPTGPTGPSGPSGPTGPTPILTPLVFSTPGQIAVFSTPGANFQPYPGAACTPPALALSTDGFGAWTCATPIPASAAPTATPLVFGTPGQIPVFATTEFGTYPGSACTPPALALSTDAAGAWTCATPLPASVAPTATPLTFGTPGVLVAFAATELGAYPGAACTPPALALSTDASGAWTCATPVPQPTATPIQLTAAPVAITLPNASSTGTTTNKLAKLNTDGTVVIVASTDTTGAIGPVISGAGTTGSALIGIVGAFSCIFDGATTAGHIVGISSGTAGDCTDLGDPTVVLANSLVAVLGTVTTTNGGAGTYTVIFQTPDIFNTTNIKGNTNPGKGNVQDLTYSGKLNITGLNNISASATPAPHDRYIRCTSGSSSDQTYTLPAATGTGRVLNIKKIDSGTKACIVARAGSDTIDGATSVTLSAQYQSVTVIDSASAVWDIQ